MNVYRVHNLPTLHPELKIQFTYQLEGKFLAVSRDGIYATLPKDRDIQICQATNGYLCMMNQALYPIEKIEWCIYALFERNYSKIGEYCVVDTKVRRNNRECVPSPGHFFHLPITFIVVFQINAGYVYMLNTYLSIQL